MGFRPIISIITPVFNGEKYIAETIDSILNSSINIPYEYLVIDDGSTDSTLEILINYGNRIQLHSHKNVGESETVNRGLKHAKGDFILIISADDPLLTGKLINRAINTLLDSSRVVALYPDWRVIDQEGRTIKENILPEYSDEIMIGRSRCLPGPGVVFRRSAALEIGGRRSKWKFVGDYDFWLRLSRVGEIKRLPGVMAQWRSNENSTSISQRGERMAFERIAVISDFTRENEITHLLSRKARANAHYLAARLAFFDQSINGRKLLISSFRIRHGWPEEARIEVVIYLLFLPFSSWIIKKLPKLHNKIVRGHE